MAGLEHLLQLPIALKGVLQFYLTLVHFAAHNCQFCGAIFLQILHPLCVCLLELYLYLFIFLVPLLIVVLLHGLFVLLRFDEAEVLGVEFTLKILLFDGHALELAGDIEFIHCHLLHLRL